MRQAAACRIIVNKITEQLVLLIKVTSLYCEDRYQLCNVRQLHSPVKLEPHKRAAWGEHGDGVFCFLLCVVCCCVCKRRVGSWMSAIAHKYDISYYGIVLGT